jgi:ABC-type multidrug transport system fused ATPase/permease subunit
MYSKIIRILTKKEQRKFLSITLLSLIMAILDMVGISTILPFMSVITNPKIIESNLVLSYIYKFFKFSSVENFIFFLGIIVFVSIVISVVYKLLIMRMQLRFILDREYAISKRLLESYLTQSYEWFLKKNTSELGKNVLSDVNTFVNSALLPLMNLITNLLLLCAILGLLFFVNFSITIFSIIFFSVLYGFIFKFSSKYLLKLGNIRDDSNEERYSVVSGVFSSIKEVKLTGLENEFLKRYDRPAKDFATNQSLAQIVNLIPRFAIEIFAFGGLVLFILYFINFQSMDRLIPTLSVFAFAAFRLMPVLQNIFGSLNIMKFSWGIIDSISKDLKLYVNPKYDLHESSKLNIQNDLTIKMHNVSYFYPSSDKQILNDINLEILPGKMIAIVGLSGSGKTTLIDVLIGLLNPTEGHISCGRIDVNENNILGWQSLIGYVPQDIYLIEDSIVSNIAFGVPRKNINWSLVYSSAKLASIDEFIENCEHGYNTILGADGVRLSGGQRQRIGLARAFYKEPKLLVLDEATSSLDSITENSVMNSIFNLNNVATVIVTHRLNTIKNCDEVFMMKNGRILQNGSYDEMKINCFEFVQLVKNFES